MENPFHTCEKEIPDKNEVCLICLQMYNGESEKGDIEIRTLEHHQTVFNKVSKYLCSEIFEGCFQWNFVEERNSPVCPACYSSVEKIFKMNEMLEKLQKTIQELINSFTSEVLGHHNRLRDLCTSEYDASTNVNHLSTATTVEAVGEEVIEVEIKEENDYVIEEEVQVPTLFNLVLPKRCEKDLDNDSNDFDPLEDSFEQEENASIYYNAPSNSSKTDFSDRATRKSSDISNRYPGVHLKDLTIILTRLVLDSDVSTTTPPEYSSRPRRKAAVAATASLKRISDEKNTVNERKLYKKLTQGKESDTECEWQSDIENDSETDSQSSANENLLSTNKIKSTSYVRRRSKIFRVVKRFKCQFKSCNSSFNFTKELKSHISKSGHNNDNIFKCGKKNCSKNFFSKMDLKNHTAFLHKNNYFHCKTCLNTFRHKKALLIHQRNYHADKLFKCDTCEETFTRKINLTAHQKLHTEKYSECKLCSSKFLWKISVNEHTRIKHSGENFHHKCSLCGKRFLSRLRFIQHRLIHFKSKIGKTYRCAACKKIHFVEKMWDNCIIKHFRKYGQRGFICAICTVNFRTSRELDDHSRENRHLNKKLFPCGICKRPFYKSDDLRAHRKVHSLLIASKSVIKLNSHGEIGNPNSRDLKCVFCGRQFKRSSVLVEHMKIHKDEKRYKCEVCNKKFRLPYELKIHANYYCGKIRKDSETKGFECLFCDSVFKSEDEVALHLKTHKGKRRKMPCKICGKIYRKEHLLKHMEIHSEVKQFKCDKCELSFNMKDKLERHEISAHTDKRPFACNLCSSKFKSKISLSRHLQRCHNRSSVVCDICGKKFSNLDRLRVHQKKHTGNMFNCTYDFCERKFYDRMRLTEHIEVVHTKEKQYSCELCQKTLTTNASLQLHLRTHAGETPFACTYCDRKFNTKQKMEGHVSRIHAERKIKCDLCEKCFALKTELAHHFKFVHGDKKFQCEFCPYMCRMKHHLTIHIKAQHIKERPYVCEVCGKSFTRKHVLDIHKKVHDKVKAIENKGLTDS